MKLRLNDRESLYLETSTNRKIHVYTDNMGEFHIEQVD